MATKMKMVSKGGKMVPAFAADGKGKMKMGGAKKTTYKTGGMVNPNAKVLADNTPGSKGVKSGVNPKATVIPAAKYGMTIKLGGAKPKAMYGASMKPGMMKKGGAKKAC